MENVIITTEQAKETNTEELFSRLNTGQQGLSSKEAKKRLEEYGVNVLEEKHVNPILKFFKYFWGPIPWMIEVAAVLSATVQRWPDFTIIMVLLIFNGLVGFFEEHKAGNAIEALKHQLALKSRVLRDGNWQALDARQLVPGDIIRIRLGDVIPADVKLVRGQYLSVDQSALTGESLPVSKKAGDVAYSGSIAKMGEMVALVTSTGSNTYFGRTAKLVATAKSVSHFQKAVLQIGDYLIYVCLFLAGILMVVQIDRKAPLLDIVQFTLVLVIASIPVAMPAVLSVTMALGALILSKMKAIVSRLEAIEEMAGMDILCSDKTGTLTQNKLTLGDPVTFDAEDTEELMIAAALASKAENQDAIDLAILSAIQDHKVLNDYHQIKFIPFDPVNKRTEGTVEDIQGKTVKITKGAPQVIIGLSQMSDESRKKAKGIVNEFAKKGYRTLGVARKNGNNQWRFMGILPFYDPPREDSATTVAKAKSHGIDIKMITGDNLAIARQISGELGLGQNICAADKLFKVGDKAGEMITNVAEQVEQTNGFAQVFPEHKYGIVKALQARNHIVGMTGDGVNDAPALKQADVGIAVGGATEAAQAAADLVLTSSGLSIIIKAVETARQIFERMNSYAIYRITETIRIMFFIVLAIIVYNFYPITARMIILLALLNDLPIMTIAYDNTWLDPNPVSWNMRRVLTLASTLGGVGVIETFGLLVIAKTYFGVDQASLQSIVFLKLAVAGHLTLLVARTKKAFLSKPYPAPILLGAILITKLIAVLIVAFGWFVTPIPWSYIGYIFIYCIIWIFIEDLAKLGIYHHFDIEKQHERSFVNFAKSTLLHHACHVASGNVVKKKK